MSVDNIWHSSYSMRGKFKSVVMAFNAPFVPVTENSRNEKKRKKEKGPLNHYYCPLGHKVASLHAAPIALVHLQMRPVVALLRCSVGHS